MKQQSDNLTADNQTDDPVGVPRIMIMGVGNILCSDEGLGVHFLQELLQETLPANVEILEGGTAGMELLHLMEDVDFLIVVDAVNAQSQSGTLFRFRPEDIRVYPDMFQTSFHQIGILEVVNTMSFLGYNPEIMIYGVQPDSLEWGIGTTPEVKAVFPRLKDRILKEVDHIFTHHCFL